MDSLSKNDPKVITKRISQLYIVDNKDLFEMFYWVDFPKRTFCDSH